MPSWGRGCGDPQFPSVHTRLGAYRAWIEQEIGAPLAAVESLATPRSDRRAAMQALEDRLQRALGPAGSNLTIAFAGDTALTRTVSETVAVTVSSRVAGALYLFNVDAHGHATQIFPNPFVTNDVAKVAIAGQPFTVPNGAAYGFSGFEMAGPPGAAALIAIVAPSTIAPVTTPDEAAGRSRLEEVLGEIERRLAGGEDPERWGAALLPYALRAAPDRAR